MNVEEYFDENKTKLKEVYEILRSTEFGKELSLPPWNVKSYEDFKKLPIIHPKEVSFEKLFIPGNGLWRFKTSGVTGKAKTVYRDIGTIESYAEDMDKMLRNNLTVFLHSKRREGESYYEVHDINHKRMYPNGIFLEYENKKQLLEYVQKGEVLFIVEYPLMAEWICYQLEEALENMPSQSFAKKKVYLELSGEPVTEAQVQNIITRMMKIFQCDVEYSITYGSTETGLIGTYIPTLHGSRIIYEVSPSLFVEEIDGEIILTPFRKRGTILFRYKIGDRGKLFFKENKPFLQDIRRCEGNIYVAGAQVNVVELISYLKNIISYPIAIEFFKREDSIKGVCFLNVVVHTPKGLPHPIKNKLASSIKNFIINSAKLSVETRLGIVKIDVQFTTSPLKKQWRIIETNTNNS